MNTLTIKSGQRARVLSINGTASYQLFLLSLGLKEGIEFRFNYSPQYSKLISISLGGKMIALRRDEFDLITYTIIEDA